MTREVVRDIEDAVRPLPGQEPEQFEFVPEPMPCDDCPHVTACGIRQLACRAFAQYVKTGRWKTQAASRLPSRRPYLRLFRH